MGHHLGRGVRYSDADAIHQQPLPALTCCDDGGGVVATLADCESGFIVPAQH
jgi:hypothetical protein